MTKKNSIVSCVFFLAIFAVYLHTLNPVFRADDSPETIASCVTLGIQHPPSYPLFTLVGRIASFIPLASPAWRLNMLAGLMGALTCMLTISIGILWTGSLGAGIFAATVLGLSPTFWSQSLAAKGGIYTLNALLLALLVLALALWDRDMQARLEEPQSSRLRLLQSRYFLLSCLFTFLGFGNHWETQALFIPPLLAWLFTWMRLMKIDARRPSGKGLYSPLLKASVLAPAALSVYLLLPLRARLHPAMNWGVPDSWQQFCWVVFRQEYLDIEVGFLKALKGALLGGGDWASVASNWNNVQQQGMRVISHLIFPGDLGWFLFPLAVLGTWAMFKGRRFKELAFCLILLGGFSFAVTFYFQLKPEMIWIMDVFLIPTYLVEALMAGFGVSWIEERLKQKHLALIAALLLFPSLVVSRAATLSQHDHFWAWDYGNNFLMSLKKDAIVFAEGDFNTMPIYYLQHVEGKRPDVTHITTIFISTAWGVDELKVQHPELGVTVVPHVDPNLRVGDGALLQQVLSEIIEKNQGKRPIQASLFREVEVANLASAEPFMSPSGLSDEYKAPETPAQWQRRMNLPKAMVIRYLPDEKSRFDPSPQFALSNYGTLYLDLANYARSHGHVDEAMPLYATAVNVTTEPNKAEAYTHWGIALASQGKYPEAIAKFKDALGVKPLFEAYANLAGVMNQMKKYADAEPYARQAIAMQPDNSQSWNNLAIALYYSGKRSEAIASLEKAASLDPQNAGIQANLHALEGTK